MSVFFSRFMGNESQCGTNKSRELRYFLLGSWEMNRSVEQTNRTRTASLELNWIPLQLNYRVSI